MSRNEDDPLGTLSKIRLVEETKKIARQYDVQPAEAFTAAAIETLGEDQVRAMQADLPFNTPGTQKIRRVLKMSEVEKELGIPLNIEAEPRS